MHEYDRDVYGPALKELQAECAAGGHPEDSLWHDNGFCAVWQLCRLCGAKFNVLSMGYRLGAIRRQG